MKVVCNTVDDFLENLKAVEPGRVLQGAVRVSISKTPEDNDGVKFSVVFQASAIISFLDCNDEFGEYLLEVGVSCGYDLLDASQDRSASEKAQKSREEVVAFCRQHGLKVLPGLISE